MIYFLAIGLLFFILLYVREHARYKNLCKEISYVNERLKAVSFLTENSFILIPTANTYIREISAGINRMLETFYAQKSIYNRQRQAMAGVLTNISHDLRTPLTVLKGYSELLCRRVKDSREFERAEKTTEMAELADMAAKINGKADELTAAIEEYFTMSKIESGDTKLTVQKINISQLCHEILLDYYDLLEKEEYRVELQTGEAPVFAQADEEALRRILKNLIDNAIKHGGSGKYLAIRFENEADKVCIKVEDHGDGIPPREQELIFLRNYTVGHKQSGNGLGLTIARNMAQQMGADIQVFSEPGRRTIFTLYLKC